MFNACPGLEPFRGSLEEIYHSFNQYKRTVPVRGAILLDPTMEKCLLVRGYKADAGWGFPRGKLSKDETDAQCAIREVLEETGFDISSRLQEEHYIDVKIGDQDTRLFIIAGVDESTPFAPHVRGEIGAFGWHVISHLPSTWEESKQLFVNDQGGRHKFYNVWPYIKALRSWTSRRSRQLGKSTRATATTPVAGGPGECWRNFAFNRQEIMAVFDSKLMLKR
jgi:mRNA-decapping enzyme subunit 2